MEEIFNFEKDKKIILATHSGTFHADEMFASVVLGLLLKKEGYIFEIIRTRNPDIIASADIVYDVGGIYNFESFRFDHHQPEDIGERDGVPYSSFGLVWKHFGMALCNHDINIWNEIERRLVLPIDAADNGIETYKTVLENVSPVIIQSLIGTFNETWKESEDGNQDKLFFECLLIVEKCFIRILNVSSDNVEGATLVNDIYEKAQNKSLIVLESPLPWDGILSSKEDTMLVVYPSKNKDKTDWHIKGVGIDPGSFARRHYFPTSWRGLQSSELESVVGIPGMIFCHKSGFMLAANSKETAVKIAELELSRIEPKP